MGSQRVGHGRATHYVKSPRPIPGLQEELQHQVARTGPLLFSYQITRGCVRVCVHVCVCACWGVLGGGGRWPAGDLTNESFQRTIVQVSWYHRSQVPRQPSTHLRFSDVQINSDDGHCTRARPSTESLYPLQHRAHSGSRRPKQEPLTCSPMGPRSPSPELLERAPLAAAMRWPWVRPLLSRPPGLRTRPPSACTTWMCPGWCSHATAAASGDNCLFEL